MTVRLTGRSWAFWVSLVSLSGIVLAFFLLWQILRPYKGYETAQRIVQIERGSTLSEISTVLQSEGIIRSAALFRWYVRLTDAAAQLKAGEYLFDGPIHLADVADKLLRGQVHRYRVTVPEGLTFFDIARLLSEQGWGKEENLLKAMKQGDLVASWDPLATENLEGYLFPDTYFFTRDMTEKDIVGAMVENFRSSWTPEHAQRTEELGFTVRQLVTLASLIEKETGRPEERALVSAVFHNRLKRNLKLACDPTVIYAVKLVKEFDGTIHQSDLEFDSPYNTYLYVGLPPGPIANPGLASIEAALHPAEVDYLYFVATDHGAHFFSNSYREHQRAVGQYQR